MVKGALWFYVFIHPPSNDPHTESNEHDDDEREKFRATTSNVIIISNQTMP
jgi:hypothetical protein